MNRYSILPILDALNGFIKTDLATYAPTEPPDLFLLVSEDGVVADWDYYSLGLGLPFYTRAEIDSPFSGTGAAIELGVDAANGSIAELHIINGGSGYAFGQPVGGTVIYPRIACKPFIGHVYSNIPTVFSDSPPFCFIDYIKGEQRREGFTKGSMHGSQMTHTIEWNVCQDLAKNTTIADAMANAFVGVAYDFMRRHDSLDGAVDRITIKSDRVETVEVNGGAGVGVTYLANIFTIEIEVIVGNI